MNRSVVRTQLYIYFKKNSVNESVSFSLVFYFPRPGLSSKAEVLKHEVAPEPYGRQVKHRWVGFHLPGFF